MPNFLSTIRNPSISVQIPNFPRGVALFSTYSSPAAENFLMHLQGDDAQVEKKLSTVKAKLDSQCVREVLKRCAIDKPKLGLRFFIWAALHPTYRHTNHMYDNACKSLGVLHNPRIIIDVIDKYRDEGFSVSIKMFKVVLNLCSAANDNNLAICVLRKMKEFNCRPDTVSYNVVIRLFVVKGDLDGAMGLMKDMSLIDLYPNMVTYVLIVKGLCDAGRLEDAFGLIKVMKGHGCVPNSVVYSTLLDGLCEHGSLEAALELLGMMEKESEMCKPNVVTYTTMIKGFVGKGRALEAVRILDKMNDSGLKPNRVTFVALLDGLCREDHVEEAYKVVNKYGGGDFQYDELCSLFVVSILRAGKHKEAVSMFKTMMARGLRPSGLASSSVIKCVISEGRILDAFSLFDALEKSGNLLHIDPHLCTTLLARLCRENHFAEAAKVVQFMVEEKICLKSSHAEDIIRGLDSSGEYDLASNISRING